MVNLLFMLFMYKRHEFNVLCARGIVYGIFKNGSNSPNLTWFRSFIYLSTKCWSVRFTLSANDLIGNQLCRRRVRQHEWWFKINFVYRHHMFYKIFICHQWYCEPIIIITQFNYYYRSTIYRLKGVTSLV